MKIQRPIVALIILLLSAACAPIPGPTAGPQVQLAPAKVQVTGIPLVTTTAPTLTLAPTGMATARVETAAPNCLGDEVNPVGKSIAEDYTFSSYEQVMTWFCNGAEFEDILVALETESQTGTPADEMLKMLAAGFTWDEIWQTIGLTD